MLKNDVQASEEMGPHLVSVLAQLVVASKKKRVNPASRDKRIVSTEFLGEAKLIILCGFLSILFGICDAVRPHDINAHLGFLCIHGSWSSLARRQISSYNGAVLSPFPRAPAVILFSYIEGELFPQRTFTSANLRSS